ncbi:NAD-dependent succinate-semialdehyde dehydrogenase [Kordiimonas pumila]|uniref:NAD-dependent succinate-semialdehyde dehydrogenase n=1 Tax=Kordiimonas pumila TaxID=2161677 RepID=A0ABV7D298_9PROT|nr:NAD-dependent succinate-semialdehyde dehydrogenase [Kordiimonas pumila]
MILQDQSLLKDKAYINGEWVGGDALFDVKNPATGEVIIQLPDLARAATKTAIDAAEAAQVKWRSLVAKERSAILKRWYDLIMAAQDDLAKILTLEMGKPLAEAKGEVAYGASFIEWFAEEGKRVYGDVIPQQQGDKRLLVLKQPIGVVAAITPWNFPNAMITRKVAPALAVGCSVVVKPAAETPLSALALAALAEKAGIPAGVLNVVVGTNSREIGGELCENPKVRKLTFTGSTGVGRILMRQCSDDIKKVSLELGGNAPFIVFDDADIDAAVEGAMASKYRNSGQTCVCANRLYVQAGVYEAFLEKFTAAVRKLKVGNGMDEGVVQGPLINEKALDKVEEHIADALEKGGTIIEGGKRHSLGGSFFEPTIIRDVTQNMKVSKEETFGPLAPVFKFENEADVVAMANDTEFGLASYFYARDLSRVWRVAEALEYGMVGINTGILSTEVAPFGGVKQSGLGREGSKYGIDDYLEMKYLCMAGI